MTQLHQADPVEGEPGSPRTLRLPRVIFIADIPFGFEIVGDGLRMVGDATIGDPLRSGNAGLPRVSVLATIADCIAGVPAGLVTGPRLAVTLDIAVRLTGADCGAHLDVRGEIVKPGRTT